MPIIKVAESYADSDFGLLSKHLKLLDIEISTIHAAITVSRDPDADGLCEAGEYFIGHGFVAIQRYLASTRAGIGISQTRAFGIPPMVQNGLSFAASLNAAANYWKHLEEWHEKISGPDDQNLGSQAMRTLEQIELITPWEDYTCSNLLAVLLAGQAFKLSLLLPNIETWRNNLFAHCNSSN